MLFPLLDGQIGPIRLRWWDSSRRRGSLVANDQLSS
jgi:hypothetical protein